MLVHLPGVHSADRPPEGVTDAFAHLPAALPLGVRLSETARVGPEH